MAWGLIAIILLLLIACGDGYDDSERPPHDQGTRHDQH